MVQTIQAKNVTLEELKTIFNLQIVRDDDFFREWQDELPEITEFQKQQLDQIEAGYFNLLEYPPMLEKTISLSIVSPLLFVGEFYLQPFYIKPEKSVEFSEEDEGAIIKSSIDTFVLKEQLWLMVIESKRASFSIEEGLAQILAYMLANPNPDKPSYGMIATGGSFIFVKLVNGELPRYGTSKGYLTRNPGNELYDVLRILKRLTQLVISN
ncbi:restriction endonuclease subunit R [Tychonema sp. LEGE 07203]|uniref:restriction endonuclease subunit R n=1 Tax=Tychonema sp. LEGE 07203 TaxID=1828671 RepID=UPI00187EF63D|nr:restriction endonuclease subunit R [Tychonema sp. LEGE 07203]MBE9092636.1 restriction endonuclease subunit R [Tychonema sp. LEGE 07203]